MVFIHLAKVTLSHSKSTPFGFLAAKEAGFTATNLASIFIVVIFTAKHTWGAATHTTPIGVTVVGTTKEPGGVGITLLPS